MRQWYALEFQGALVLQKFDSPVGELELSCGLRVLDPEWLSNIDLLGQLNQSFYLRTFCHSSRLEISDIDIFPSVRLSVLFNHEFGIELILYD